MRKVFELGGLVAAAVLIVFGVVAIAMGVSGRSTVGSELKQQSITGSADMTPAAIQAEAAKSGLRTVNGSAPISFPSCSVANRAIDTGARARCFAQYMRIHALEATGGYTYSQMGMYLARPNAPASALLPGGGTDNAIYALVDARTKQPVANGARNVWVTETALATALDASYMASKLALFGVVTGVAFLLTGIGFAILAIAGALRNPQTAPTWAARRRRPQKPAVAL